MNLTRDLRSAKAKPSGNTVWFRNKTRESQTELDGIVGGGSVFAVIYSILNAVRNKTLNSKVLSILRERATPMTEQEISSLLEIPLARLQRRIDSLFGQGLIEQVASPHWQERAQRGWRPRDQRAARPGA